MNNINFDSDNFSINQVVYHPIWGKGVIREFTIDKGVNVYLQKSVTRWFITTVSHISGEDHYTHLYLTPIKIVEQ